MSDDLISRKAIIEAVDRHTREDGTLDNDISIILEEVKTAFDKEKVIEKLKVLFERSVSEILDHVGSDYTIADFSLEKFEEKISRIVENGGIE